MKAYIGIFRMRFIAGLQYRAAAWAGVSTQFFWGLMSIMVYAALYRTGESAPMEFSALVSYMWLRQAFLVLLALWITDSELMASITSGNVAYELCRPYRMYSFWFMRLLAQRVASASLRCLPILLVAFVLPSPWGIILPPSPLAFAAFVAALTLAAMLTVAVSMFVCILTFITLDSGGPRLIIGTVAEFLSGTLIPLPFMPQAMQDVLRLMPFAYTTDFTFRVYTGDISGIEVLTGIGIQLLWLTALISAGSWCFRRIQSKIVIQGG